MAKYSTDDIRNIAMIGHAGAGKTTLVEALLEKAGAIPAMGDVEKGSTVCDFDPQEKTHQRSLTSALVSIDHGGKHLNIIDTPGYPDFMGQAIPCLNAVETGVMVINASAGIEMITRRMMDRSADAKLARLIVVNRIDADNLQLEELIGQIQESFGSVCLPVNLPTGGGTGVVDVLGKADGDADFSSVSDAHTAIVDQIVEVDEELMEKYLEEGEVSPEDLAAPLVQALKEGHLIPICFTSAKTGAGVAELLDMLGQLALSPTQGSPKPFKKDGEELEIEVDAAKPVVAHVFKVAIDPFVGKMGVIRVHRGTMTKDSQLHIGDDRKPTKIGHLMSLQGKDHNEVSDAPAGDICAVAKIEDLTQDVVLNETAGENLTLKGIYPTPMHGLAIEAKSRGDETKIGKALHALDAEDPCFKIEQNAATHERVIYGLGDLHMRVCLEKMSERYNAEVDTHPPKIAYREAIRGEAEGHHRHKKQSGGAGQFGEVYLRVSPLADDSEFAKSNGGDGLEFCDDIFGGAIPGQFLPAIEKGIRMVLTDGCIAGYPMQDVKVSVYDGKYHAVDSKEVAFITAGKRAFMDAVNKAKPSLLEPIVNMEITVPDANMGDIASDLSGKRGRIQGQDTLPGGMIAIRAQAPLGELGNYQSQLKSVTGGQGSYSMELSHYEPVPPNVQQQIVAAYKPKDEED